MVENVSVVRQQKMDLAMSGGVRLEIGAQVGVRRNDEFSAGGRHAKISRNAWVSYRPVFDRATT